jgi:glycosyltransferase involved in cell wall biosynthesis
MPLRRLRATINPRVQLDFAGHIPADIRALEALVRSRSIDVVQVHGATNAHGAFAARRAGAAVVWQLFDTRAPMLLRRIAMPLVVRRADAMTTWGRELARVHPGAERLGERLIVVYPPVDRSEVELGDDARTRARTRLQATDEDVVVGSIGVLNPQKGHEEFIRAARLLADRQPSLQFRILGGVSPAHAAYERFLRREVEEGGLADRFGFIDPGPEVPELLQGFDILAMTSVPRSEGMPPVILEAMMAGKPVVPTDVGAVRELVEPDVSALVVEPLKPNAIADAIERLVRDRELSVRIADAGRTRAHSLFDLERLADLHARAYRMAIENAARRSS